MLSSIEKVNLPKARKHCGYANSQFRAKTIAIENIIVCNADDNPGIVEEFPTITERYHAVTDELDSKYMEELHDLETKFKKDVEDLVTIYNTAFQNLVGKHVLKSERVAQDYYLEVVSQIKFE